MRIAILCGLVPFAVSSFMFGSVREPTTSATAAIATTDPILEDWPALRAKVDALSRLTGTPQQYAAEGFSADNGIRPLFFEALAWKGKATRVFAWLGIPPQHEGNKVPGVVLVHGGGGTAYKEWVKKWNEHGFAAISIAVEGQTDVRPTAPARAKNEYWQRHAYGGPARNGLYGDSAERLSDQWMYHAVADVVLANSLLRAEPAVDAHRVGVMGVSWGGVITSTVIGLDSRFAFAVPTYGCGHLADAENSYGRALGPNEMYRQVWDPMLRLDRARMPVLWLSWPEDIHFPLDCQAACYQAAPGPHMVTLIPGMKHGHTASWTRPDSYAFAESVVRDGAPWFRQTSVTVTGSRVQVTFTSRKPLAMPILVSTTGTGFTGTRQWVQTPAQLERKEEDYVASAELPAGTTAWFINVNASGLTASSDFQECAPRQ